MSSFEENYLKLNNEQREAVDTVFGPVLVVAGPGSGKTQLLALRVANILKETDTAPNQILCLTFTDSAANNMRARLSKIMYPGTDAYKVAVHTFHSFATEIIAQNQEYFFFGAGFRPAEQLSQVQILRSIFESLDKQNNPIASFHSEQDYVFLNDALQVIDAIKRAGLSPNEFKEILDSNREFLDICNPNLEEIFSEKISVKTVENLWKLIELITQINTNQTLKASLNKEKNHTHQWNEIFPFLSEHVLMQLQQAWDKAHAITEKISTTPVTAWKNEFTAKNTQNQINFKDLLKLDRWYTLADIYFRYQVSLYSQGLFDFSDMLLEVAKALEDESRIDLKYNLQEKFQFILVDEFQDTNGVQMRLLENLIDAPQNEGNPNLLLVGDDDQAIFKFQGANIENMLKFKENFPSTKIIRLNKNYRSTQDILDLAMSIIEQSSQRLDIEGQKKTIEAVRI